MSDDDKTDERPNEIQEFFDELGELAKDLGRAAFENMVSTSKEHGAKVDKEKDEYGTERVTVKFRGYEYERIITKNNDVLVRTGWHGIGYDHISLQEQTAARGDMTPGVLDGPGQGVNPGISLQHDLGRDGYGNDDTSQNPSRGGNSPASAATAYGGGEYGGGGNTAASDAVGYGGGEYGGGGSSSNSGGTPSEEESGEGLDPGEENPGGEGGGGGKPIVLDLDGDGVELVALEDSTAFYDINSDGYRERMAWASADDGFLAYDKDGDGSISAHDELSFVSYVEGAQTDLEGLAHFDTNGNGKLDSGDAEWSKFRVGQDLDQDGESDAGELRTLDEAGITETSLTSDGVEQTVAGNAVFGEGSYTDAGDIFYGDRHCNPPTLQLLQRRHLIPQAWEVDVDGAGVRVFAADCDFGRACMDNFAFHGVEGEILCGHADARAGRDVAGAAG